MLEEIDRAVLARAVIRVVTGTHQSVHGKGNILDGTAEGAHLVKRGAKATTP
mgnify:CR=1 FL=1